MSLGAGNVQRSHSFLVELINPGAGIEEGANDTEMTLSSRDSQGCVSIGTLYEGFGTGREEVLHAIDRACESSKMQRSHLLLLQSHAYRVSPHSHQDHPHNLSVIHTSHTVGPRVITDGFRLVCNVLHRHWSKDQGHDRGEGEVSQHCHVCSPRVLQWRPFHFSPPAWRPGQAVAKFHPTCRREQPSARLHQGRPGRHRPRRLRLRQLDTARLLSTQEPIRPHPAASPGSEAHDARASRRRLWARPRGTSNAGQSCSS
mmetsp:Transcript_62314/g.147680  ORF Transcript_62314/g.147680 Transcript_62314/m.147680 type:complete len:258 (+) Transcript_62314:953-1726(+)